MPNRGFIYFALSDETGSRRIVFAFCQLKVEQECHVSGQVDAVSVKDDVVLPGVCEINAV